ncbi:exosome complex protein Rrp42 [Candidatus Woesearchaeota archaeon]|nr:MAG: exosome complex protein Rrp42 [Candidatus Woesearchaeota archaeon]
MADEHIVKALAADVRYDGRKKLEYRDVKVEYGVSKSAEGSARVSIGETVVMAGVKMELTTPYADRPNEGNIMVNAELLPLSSPRYEPGPPGEKATEIARVVDRGIRESKAIDTTKLCIAPGEKAWGVLIDVVSINDAGNLQDAAALAAIAALKNARLPQLSEHGQIDYDATKTDKPLPLEREPVEVTVYKIGEHYFIDPLCTEEDSADARLTIAVTEKDTICALQKGGVGPLTVEDIDHMIGIAQKHSKQLRKAL